VLIRKDLEQGREPDFDVSYYAATTYSKSCAIILARYLHEQDPCQTIRK